VILLRLLKVSETAKILRVKKSFVYELIEQGKLKAIRLSERRIRVPEEALKEFIEQAVKA
jgi:excisionase family DNA binding protein